MVWGKPNPQQLLDFMKDVSDKNLIEMNHEHTKKLVGASNVLHEFFMNVISTENDNTNDDSVTH
jgi:hypothetical protein